MPNSSYENNRSLILHTAESLFAQRGYSATGIKDLERACDIGRSSLYYYFSNKEELLFEITTRYLRALIARGQELLDKPASADERLRCFSRIVIRSVADDLAAQTVCFRETHALTGKNKQASLDLHREYEWIWSRLLESGVEQGAFSVADPITVKAVIGMHHYSYLWLRSEGKMPPESIADVFCDLILNGLGTGSLRLNPKLCSRL